LEGPQSVGAHAVADDTLPGHTSTLIGVAPFANVEAVRMVSVLCVISKGVAAAQGLPEVGDVRVPDAGAPVGS
jgi:hypothetical protein